MVKRSLSIAVARVNSPPRPRRPWKSAKRWVVYAAVRILAAPCQVLPLAVAVSLAEHFGQFLGRLPSRFRRHAQAQIEARLQVSRAEARVISSDMFRNLGRVAMEVACLSRIIPKLDFYVDLPPTDRAVLEEALSLGQGAILVSAHLGNWELFGQRLNAAGFHGASIARTLPNPFLNRWLMKQRRHTGLTIIPRGEDGAIRKMLSVFRRGELLALFVDQDTSVPSVFVSFLGKTAKTPRAPAELAIKKGIPLVFGYAQKSAHGLGYRIHLESIAADELDGQTTEEAIMRLTTKINQRIEDVVRSRPSEWVWVHERWRSTPPSETQRS
jgi:Kdo2-lipid IVA lauroyltransferase/acyltransferase